MPINIQDYLLGRIPVGRKIDIPAYLMAKAASGGGIQEITGTLPLYVRSRASQVLKNYRFYGTSEGAGVETENLWDGTFYQGSIKVPSLTTRITTRNIPIEPGMTYSLKLYGELPSICDFAFVVRQGNSIIYDSGWNDTSTFVYIVPQDVGDYYAEIIIKRKTDGNISPSDAKSLGNLAFTKGSTAPSSYIPYGYKLPITVTSNGTTTDYPIYIGDTKLGEEEYVDYEEQKIYKLVDGTLTPTDPPVPLPDITLPQGKVIIDIDGDIKPQATVKGKIEQI